MSSPTTRARQRSTPWETTSSSRGERFLGWCSGSRCFPRHDAFSQFRPAIFLYEVAAVDAGVRLLRRPGNVANQGTVKTPEDRILRTEDAQEWFLPPAQCVPRGAVRRDGGIVG